MQRLRNSTGLETYRRSGSAGSESSLANVDDCFTGENDFFTDASCLQKLGRSRAKKFLSAFKEGRWRADRTGQFRTAEFGNKAR